MLTQLAFVAHPEFSQDTTRRSVADKMMGVDGIQSQRFESKTHDCERRFRAITLFPKRHADPVTELSTLVLRTHFQTYRAAQFARCAQRDRKNVLLTLLEFVAYSL